MNNRRLSLLFERIFAGFVGFITQLVIGKVLGIDIVTEYAIVSSVFLLVASLDIPTEVYLYSLQTRSDWTNHRGLNQSERVRLLLMSALCSLFVLFEYSRGFFSLVFSLYLSVLFITEIIASRSKLILQLSGYQVYLSAINSGMQVLALACVLLILLTGNIYWLLARAFMTILLTPILLSFCQHKLGLKSNKTSITDSGCVRQVLKLAATSGLSNLLVQIPPRLLLVIPSLYLDIHDMTSLSLGVAASSYGSMVSSSISTQDLVDQKVELDKNNISLFRTKAIRARNKLLFLSPIIASLVAPFTTITLFVSGDRTKSVYLASFVSAFLITTALVYYQSFSRPIHSFMYCKGLNKQFLVYIVIPYALSAILGYTFLLSTTQGPFSYVLWFCLCVIFVSLISITRFRSVCLASTHTDD